MSKEYVKMIMSMSETDRQKEINKLSVPELVDLDRALNGMETVIQKVGKHYD